MGKLEQGEGAAASSSGETDPSTGTKPCHCVQLSWRCVLPVVLGFYVVAFGIWSICSRGGDGRNALPPSADPWRRKLSISLSLTLSLSLHLSSCVRLCFFDLTKLLLSEQNVHLLLSGFVQTAILSLFS